MARIGSVMLQGSMVAWRQVTENMPIFRYRLLANVGMKAARQLYYERLDMTLHPRSFSSTGAPLSAKGRRMVSFAIDNKKGKVIIRSFPLNTLRQGSGPRATKRLVGQAIFRSFEKSFDAEAAAASVLDKLLNGTGGLFANSETEDWQTKLQRSKTNAKGEI